MLRTVRTEQEGAFVPHAAVTGGIALALVCVATLVWFVHHIATSINVERVVDAVHDDLAFLLGLRPPAAQQVQQCVLVDREFLQWLALNTRNNASDKPDFARVSFEPGSPVVVAGSNYLQALDLSGLSDWAAKTQTKVRLTVRPGDYVPAGLPIAETLPNRDEAVEVLTRACTFGSQPAAVQDLEYSVRQLTEIAVRALSAGINEACTLSDGLYADF